MSRGLLISCHIPILSVQTLYVTIDRLILIKCSGALSTYSLIAPFSEKFEKGEHQTCKISSKPDYFSLCLYLLCCIERYLFCFWIKIQKLCCRVFRNEKIWVQIPICHDIHWVTLASHALNSTKIPQWVLTSNWGYKNQESSPECLEEDQCWNVTNRQHYI